MGVCFGDLFDGEVHNLDPDEDWEIPWEAEGEWVEMASQPKDLDSLETPEMNFVSTAEIKPGEHIGMYSGHQSVAGWGAVSNLTQKLAIMLGGEMVCEQFNRHASDNSIEKMWFRVQFKPGRLGWQGEEGL